VAAQFGKSGEIGHPSGRSPAGCLNLNGAAFSSKIRLQISMPFETVSLCHQAGASDISYKFLCQDWTLCDQVLEILELSACRPLFGRRMCISWCFAQRDQFFNRP
jgi:hypothetical protein